jgi:nitrogen fixation NifU-like protein
MTDSIYNDAIVAAARARTGAGRLDHPMATVTCDNPLCGDRVTLDLVTADGTVAAIAHKTRGCLLTEAAASIVAGRGIGAATADLPALQAAVQAFLDGEAPAPWPELEVFAPVQAVRSRHECVLLPFQALGEAAAEAR